MCGIIEANPPITLAGQQWLAPRGTFVAQRLLSMAERLGLITAAGGARGPPRRSELSKLVRGLVRSLDDGTPHGTQTAKKFSELSHLVSSIFAKRHHEVAMRLQDTYRCFDPNEVKPVAHGDARDAAQFAEVLHALLRTAGFRLCSLEDEARAMHGHFGNEQMWNVPTSISWADLDGSLVQGDLGGFDAYAQTPQRRRGDAPAGRTSSPCIISVGTVEKRGYFIGAKFEEILTRRTRALGSAVLSPLSRSADRVWRRCDRALVQPVASGSGWPRKGATGAGKQLLAGGVELQMVENQCRSLQSIELTLRSMLEETTLSTPTHGHVLLLYRHTDAAHEAMERTTWRSALPQRADVGPGAAAPSHTSPDARAAARGFGATGVSASSPRRRCCRAR